MNMKCEVRHKAYYFPFQHWRHQWRPDMREPVVLGSAATRNPSRPPAAHPAQTHADADALCSSRNANHTKANWHFTTPNARIKLKHLYPSI